MGGGDQTRGKINNVAKGGHYVLPEMPKGSAPQLGPIQWPDHLCHHKLRLYLYSMFVINGLACVQVITT